MPSTIQRTLLGLALAGLSGACAAPVEPGVHEEALPPAAAAQAGPVADLEPADHRPTTLESGRAHHPDPRPFEQAGHHLTAQADAEGPAPHSQSPINVLTDNIVPREHQLEMHLEYTAATLVKHEQHTMQVNFEAGATIRFDGQDYQLRQLHFHTPSEHRVDGITYPMEMHIVHTRPGTSPEVPTEYLVLGILYRMGKPSAFVQSFLDAVPEDVGARTPLDGKPVYMEQQLPRGKIPDYFHYRGSLTTPPYTEAVQWLLLKEEYEASPDQIRKINALEGDNARHLQEMYERVIDG